MLNKKKKSEIKNTNDKDNKEFFYLEMIYLFNPLSIMCCVNLQLRTIYNFLLFICLEKLSNFFNLQEKEKKEIFLNLNLFNFLKLLLINLTCILTLLISPANFFILLFFYVKNFEVFDNKRKFYFFVNFVLAAFATCFIFAVFFTNKKEPIGSLYLYYNYFFMKDTFPNFGILWNLIPEVIMK